MSLGKKAVEGAVEGAAGEVSKWVVGGLLLSIPVYGAAVLGFARENIVNPVIEHPWAFVAALVFGVLIGFTIGMLARHFSLKKARAAVAAKESMVAELEKTVAAERKGAETAAAEKDARIAELEAELQEVKSKANARSVQVNKFDRFKDVIPEHDVSKIREMDHSDKVMIMAVAVKEFVFCKTNQTCNFYLSDINRFVEAETLRNGVSRLRPTERLRRLAKERSDAFAAVGDEDLAKRDCSLDRGVITRPKTNAGGRTWWWTSSPNCAQEFL